MDVSEVSNLVTSVDERISFFVRVDSVESANVLDASGKMLRLRPAELDGKERLRQALIGIVDELSIEIDVQSRFIAAGSPVNTWV